MTKCRLWRVDITHIAGYQAPYLMVETTEDLKYKAEMQALELAKQKTRLSSFECWTFTAYCTGKKMRNGKWLTDAEIEAYRLKKSA
jgi:hypothetical protein